jgi:hypothetical protein
MFAPLLIKLPPRTRKMATFSWRRTRLLWVMGGQLDSVIGTSEFTSTADVSGRSVVTPASGHNLAPALQNGSDEFHPEARRSLFSGAHGRARLPPYGGSEDG